MQYYERSKLSTGIRHRTYIFSIHFIFAAYEDQDLELAISTCSFQDRVLEMRGRGRGEYYKNLYGRGRGARGRRDGSSVTGMEYSQNDTSFSRPHYDLSEYDVRDVNSLESTLNSINGRGYQAYKELKGVAYPI